MSSGGAVGRFAPSPTGPLHFGSLIAALGSWMSVRSRGGTWRLRIDDLDQARTVRGMADTIRRQLEAFGLTWDGPVLFQRTRLPAYADALARLEAAGAVYACSCTRREIADTATEHGPLGVVYPGTCRRAGARTDRDRALRLRLAAGTHLVGDRIQGEWRIGHERIGDVVVRRRNGAAAYHLATTLDDAHLGVTDVVRGSDLLPAAAVQIALQGALGLPETGWAHLPVVLTADGSDKLSKQTGAAAVDPDADAVGPLLEAWSFLGQPAPAGRPDTPRAFLDWAVARWDEALVPAGARLVADRAGGMRPESG